MQRQQKQEGGEGIGGGNGEAAGEVSGTWMSEKNHRSKRKVEIAMANEQKDL